MKNAHLITAKAIPLISDGSLFYIIFGYENWKESKALTIANGHKKKAIRIFIVEWFFIQIRLRPWALSSQLVGSSLSEFSQ